MTIDDWWLEVADPELIRLCDELQAQDRAWIDALRKAREAIGMSRIELADAVGVKLSTIAKLEAGMLDPRLSLLRRYVLAVGVGVAHTCPTGAPDAPGHDDPRGEHQQ